ncbi:MAG: RsmE family RNA methyltransferase, partial [Candidatus Eremiobacteraeota bacterium]|nr:RsmE family RNA methyltransferase [Candidatus Eremiobacteraeota bacterium]
MAARFFIEGTHAAGERVVFDDADAHKILHVLRLRDRDPVEVFDSSSRAFLARLAVDGSRVAAELGEPVEAAEGVGPAITVAQGIPKGRKMDFIVEKLSELGAFELLPLASARAIAEAGDVKRTRWSRLAKTAAQQCGRRSVMRIGDQITVETLAERCAGYDAVLV